MGLATEALNKIQGEWAAITDTYAPQWVLDIRQAFDDLEALKAKYIKEVSYMANESISYSNAMDGAAVEAQNDFPDAVDLELLEKSGLIDWWRKWYLKAGHKRLGRIIVRGV